MLTKASALSRLRYWLHLVQAPNYGPGFSAAERRSPSVSAGFSCSGSSCRRPTALAPLLSCRGAALRCCRRGLLAALEFLHSVDDRTTVATRAAPRTIKARMDQALYVRRQHYGTPSFVQPVALLAPPIPSAQIRKGVSSPLKDAGVPQCEQHTLVRPPAQ